MDSPELLFEMQELRDTVIDLSIERTRLKGKLRKTSNDLMRAETAFAKTITKCPNCGSKKFDRSGDSWICQDVNCRQKFHLSWLVENTISPDGETRSDLPCRR